MDEWRGTAYRERTCKACGATFTEEREMYRAADGAFRVQAGRPRDYCGACREAGIGLDLSLTCIVCDRLPHKPFGWRRGEPEVGPVFHVYRSKKDHAESIDALALR